MTSGFLTTDLKSSDADPCAQGVRLAVGLGGAEYAVGVGKEKMAVGCRGGLYTGIEGFGEGHFASTSAPGS